MSLISDIAGGIMGAGAADEAAAVQSQAATKAQALEKNNQQNSLDLQNRVLDSTTAAEQPYQTLGSTSANHLASLLNGGFQAPTLAEAQNTPGYQFRLQQGTNAINENAAATGNLMSGNTGKALVDYGQGLAESNYQNDYERALQTYMTNYTSLLGGTNVGLSSTGQLGQFGQEAATNTGNINLRSSEDQAQQINNAAAARASGYLGTAKAYSTMAGNLGADVMGGIGNMDFSGGSNVGEMAGQFLGF